MTTEGACSIAVQPEQLGIAGEVGHLRQVGGIVLPGENPADMGIEEAAVTRGVNVVLRVGMDVVVAVLGRPPQHALLGGALREAGEDELECPTRGEGAVRKIAMVGRADGEDPHGIEREADPQRGGAHARPDGGETGEVDQHERNGGGVEDVVVIVVGVRFVGHGHPLRCRQIWRHGWVAAL